MKKTMSAIEQMVQAPRSDRASVRGKRLGRDKIRTDKVALRPPSFRKNSFFANGSEMQYF